MRRKRDHNGRTLFERQQYAYLAGILQAIQEQTIPIAAWLYRNSRTKRSYARGLARGRKLVTEILESEDH